MSLKEKNGYTVETLMVPAKDGTQLHTLLYLPEGAENQNVPTLLQRTCYGSEIMGELSGAWFAERGYRVVFQDCRGTGKSEGEPDYFLEAEDGRTIGDWIAAQPWFNGALGTFGESYMGFTQYALASTNPPYLKAMAIAMSAANRRETWYPGDSFSLELCLIYWWSQAFGLSEDGWIQDRERAEAILVEALAARPMRNADTVAVGSPAKWFQLQLAHPERDDNFWNVLDASPLLENSKIPTLLIGGWMDLVAPSMLKDFTALAKADVASRLVMGPWTHMSRIMENDMEHCNIEMLAWFDRHLKGNASADSEKLSLFVMPDGGWREAAAWPATLDKAWELRDGGTLQPGGSRAGDANGASHSSFTYDPADPTPALGGISVRHENSGMVDNAAVEARDDVLVYTGDVLAEDVLVIGTPRATIFVHSDVEDFDIFVRLCDVSPDGRSVNICDGLQRFRLAVTDDPHEVSVELWPAAYTFKSGHRLRVQVAAAHFPVYHRNTSTGEALADGINLRKAHLKIYQGGDAGSAIVLPTARGTTALSAQEA